MDPKLIVFLCLAFSIQCLASSVCADLDMEILPGFDGYHKLGKWLPLRIALTSADEDVTGEITAEIQESATEARQIYSIPANLFKTAKKTQFLYVLPQSFRRNLQIKLIDNQDKEILREDTSLATLSTTDLLIVVISSTGGGLEFLAEAPSSRKTYISYSTPYGQTANSSLPDKWKGYDSVDVIVLGDVPVSALPAAQRRAIRDWVYGGGRLIVSGGAHSQDFMGTFVEELLPVRIKGTLALDAIPSLSQDFGGATIVVASSELMGDSMAVVAEDNGLPIVAERDVGDGKVIFLAFDYLDPAFRTWDGKISMWERILPPPPPAKRVEYGNLASLLPATRSVSLPSYRFVGVFLLIYILCFGALNYFILKRSNRSALIWITMPVIAVVFTIGSLGFTYMTKSSAPIVSEFSVVDVYQDIGRTRINTCFGLFSPARVDYRIEFPASEGMFVNRMRLPDMDITQDGDFKLLQNGIFQMEVPRTKTPSLQLFCGESYADFSGGVSIDLSEDSGGNITGEVISKFPFDLSDCHVFSKLRLAHIGDLASDGRAQIRLDRNLPGKISDLYSTREGEKRRFISAMKPNLARSVRGTGVIGWMEGSALKSLAQMDMGEEYKALGMALVIVHQ